MHPSTISWCPSSRGFAYKAQPSEVEADSCYKGNAYGGPIALPHIQSLLRVKYLQKKKRAICQAFSCSSPVRYEQLVLDRFHNVQGVAYWGETNRSSHRCSDS